MTLVYRPRYLVLCLLPTYLVWLVVIHGPTHKSRKTNDHTKWHLDRDIFRDICYRYGTPTIDIFVSCLHCQLEPYISWRPDSGAGAVDAMCFRCTGEYFYAFSSFSLISRCLQTICHGIAEGIQLLPLPGLPSHGLLNYYTS